MNKRNYFIPENLPNFAEEWQPVEERLKKILPLKDINGEIVTENTEILSVDLNEAADALTGEPDTIGLVDRFFEAVQKKYADMTVKELFMRPVGEVTKWRKMGNRVALLPNALVLHINSSQK